jgi:hypothetical protein
MTTLRLSQKKWRMWIQKSQNSVNCFKKNTSSSNEEFINEVHWNFLNIYIVNDVIVVSFYPWVQNFKGVSKSCHNATLSYLLCLVLFYHVKTHLWMIMMESTIIIV